ncbi:MAG: META domain-containing protein [Anaerolineales bacterium]|nr:META domain-containing protein [Anaerolineales bacterium]
MNRIRFTIIFSLILLPACAGKPTLEEFNNGNEQIEQEIVEDELIDRQLVDSELVDREWVLNLLEGNPLITGTNIILTFNDTSFSGFAGCNSYGGPYERNENGEIKIIEISSQAEGCIDPVGVLEQESEYLENLINADQYEITGNELTLSGQKGEQKLVFILREPDDMNPSWLENTQWMLVSSDGFPLIDGSVITLSFTNGEIEGYGGCRDYIGEYVADGDQIVFPRTEMISEVCDDLDLQIQESEFTTALELSAHYRIQDDQLVLELATGSSVLFERIE